MKIVRLMKTYHLRTLSSSYWEGEVGALWLDQKHKIPNSFHDEQPRCYILWNDTKTRKCCRLKIEASLPLFSWSTSWAINRKVAGSNVLVTNQLLDLAAVSCPGLLHVIVPIVKAFSLFSNPSFSEQPWPGLRYAQSSRSQFEPLPKFLLEYQATLQGQVTHKWCINF